MTLLKARGISHRFGSTQVLSHVDLDLEPGELRVVVGPNGAGKTTLLRIASGVVTPSAGRVRIGDSDVADVPRRQLARQFARHHGGPDLWGPQRPYGGQITPSPLRHEPRQVGNNPRFSVGLQEIQ